jgi:hypothetical protein
LVLPCFAYRERKSLIDQCVLKTYGGQTWVTI